RFSGRRRASSPRAPGACAGGARRRGRPGRARAAFRRGRAVAARSLAASPLLRGLGGALLLQRFLRRLLRELLRLLLTFHGSTLAQTAAGRPAVPAPQPLRTGGVVLPPAGLVLDYPAHVALISRTER